MEKREFEKLIDSTVSDEVYGMIETVYMYHPAISNAKGKEQIKSLYLIDLSVIKDMYPRAKRIANLEEEKQQVKAQLNHQIRKLEDQIKELMEE